MRKLISLHSAAVVLVLIAGNSFAQQPARTATSEKNPCVSDTARAFFLASQGETASQSANVEAALLHTNYQTEVLRCSFPTFTRSRAKSMNKELAGGVLKSETGATTNDEPAQAAAPAPAADDAAALAKKLSNPVASLISVPLQSNFDFRMGTGSGWRYTLNVQPVIPVALSPKWNMISRTIIPFIHQSNVSGTTSQTGLGDITQSLFFSPNKSEPFVWAVGPVFLIPTATNAKLGSQKFGIGPTALALKQSHGWTYLILMNHIWSVAGKSSRAAVNSTFLQPSVSYSTKDGWTYGINTESSYDWTGHHWAIPIIPSVSKLVRFGKQPVSFGGGLKCWVTTPSGGPESCSLRFVVTALFPKK